MRLLHNFRGTPALAIASLIFAASVALLVAAALLTYVRDNHDTVLGPYSEADILSTVAGTAGPAVLEAGTLSIGQERCVNAPSLIQAEVTIAFRHLDPGPPAAVPFLERAIQSRAPGCNYTVMQIPLPAAVTSGTWRLEGISRALNSGEIRYWVSESFTVVGAR